MGITIHYTGGIERARLDEMLDAARLYCAEQRWHALDIDECISGQVERRVEPPGTTGEIQDSQGAQGEGNLHLVPIDDTLCGLLVTIHPGSEPLRLTFNRAGEMVYYLALNEAGEYWEYKSLAMTTQWVGADKHIALCEFLHWLNDTYMPDLHVYDESGFYESADYGILARALDAPDAASEQLSTAFESMDVNDLPAGTEAPTDETEFPAPPRAMQARRHIRSQDPNGGGDPSATPAPANTNRRTRKHAA